MKDAARFVREENVYNVLIELLIFLFMAQAVALL